MVRYKLSFLALTTLVAAATPAAAGCCGGCTYGCAPPPVAIEVPPDPEYVVCEIVVIGIQQPSQVQRIAVQMAG